MFNPRIFHFSSILFAAFFALSSFSKAGEIINENFDSAEVNALPQNPKISVWEGPAESPFGKIYVTNSEFAGRSGKSLVFTDSSPQQNQSAVFSAKWPDAIPTSGHLWVSWKFMVAVDSPFVGIAFLGSEGWKEAASIFIMENGNAVVHMDTTKEERKVVGTYDVKKWHKVTYDFDMGKKTYDVYYDDDKVVEARAMQPTAKPLAGLSIGAGFAVRDYQGAPIYYIDDLKVESKP